MIKALIITYYWPPSGGAGVQRWLKFVKYLREFGIESIVYTHSNGEVPSIDKSLEKDIPKGITVLKQPIWEPYGIYKKILGKKSNEKINTGFLTEQKKPKRIESFSIFIRGNFFIPDARKYWVKPSIKYLNQYLTQNSIDIIISTGPPHSMHLIALGIKQKYPNMPWIADFRDPWTNIDFYKDLKLTKWADKKHHKLEKKVLQNASTVITVGQTWGNELIELGATNLKVITNGYDHQDIPNFTPPLDSKFSIAHIGSMNKARNANLLWKALSELIHENNTFEKELSIKLVGKVDYYVQEQIKTFGLEKFLTKIDYIPHNEVITEQQKSHILLLVVNDAPNAKGILTGKIFEYFSAKRPIIALAPKNGDLEKLLENTQLGKSFEDNDNQLIALKNHILLLFENKHLPYLPNQNITQFSRKNLTKELAYEIKKLVN